MIKTMQTINTYDKRCIRINHYYSPEKANNMNFDSHGMTYLNSREFVKRELDYVMGLENPLEQITRREDLKGDEI